MGELFFTGRTQAGRELRLFYEHTRVHFLETSDGPEAFPEETEITGTLEGQPIEVLSLRQGSSRGHGQAVAIETAEHGIFTAIAEGTDESQHQTVMRGFVERRDRRAAEGD